MLATVVRQTRGGNVMATRNRTYLRLASIFLCGALWGCPAPREDVEVSFPGGKFVDGKIKADPDFVIELDKKTGGAVLRKRAGGGRGATIEPCECALETGGACSQATNENPDGDITDLWCVDDGCGFCVGGIRPEPESNFVVKFRFLARK